MSLRHINTVIKSCLNQMEMFGDKKAIHAEKIKRFKELNQVTRAMLDEDGDGPITRASRAGVLTKNFIRGKSAGEIIDQCEKRR